MTVRNLSFWGLFKISLILDFLLPILASPLVAVYYFTAPDKFAFEWESKFHMYGITFASTPDTLGAITAIILALFIGFIGLFVQSAAIFFLAQKHLSDI